MARLVGRDLIDCEVPDRRLEVDSLRHGRHLLVDGIDSAPSDIVTQKTCTYYTSDNPATPPNSDCYVIQGLMTLYLREYTALSSTSESSSKALKTLLRAMNKVDPSPFLEYSEGRFGVAGVRGVRYVRGTPDDGGLVLIDNSGNDGVEGGVVGAIENRDEIARVDAGADADALSPVGISLIAIGAVGVALVAVRVARGKGRRGSSPPATASSPYAEFHDDGDDLDEKYHGRGDDARTDVDAYSLNYGSPRTPRIRGEEDEDEHEDDSIFTGLGNTPPRASPRASPPSVHGSPRFVHTRSGVVDDASVAMTAEQGYEFGDSYSLPALASPYDLAASPGGERARSSPHRRESPREYVPKVRLESPRYENPAVIRRSSPERSGRRGYYVGDTVDF